MSKTKYRIRNWKDHNRSLIQRGSITVWFSPDAIDKWLAVPTKKRGRSSTYSDEAILTVLLIRSVFHLPLRVLEGFLSSLVLTLGLCLQTPSYSQICRRSQLLGKDLQRLSNRKITDLVIDSTGLKVYGEGEWKVVNMVTANGEHGENYIWLFVRILMKFICEAYRQQDA